MEDDAPIIADVPPFIRDMEKEERMQQVIFDNAAGPNTDGEDSDGEDSDEEDAEHFSAKCLNDSGEGLELQNFRDDDDEENPGSLAKNDSGKVYIKSC
jgi:hypothetical protein